MFKKSVNSILVLYVAVSLFLGIGLLVVYVSTSSHTLALSLEEKSLEQLSRNIALELEDVVSSAENLAQMLSTREAVIQAFGGTPQMAEERLKSSLETYKSHYWAILAVDLQGKVVAGYNADMKNLEGSDHAAFDYAKAIAAGKDAFVSQTVFKNTQQDQYVFAVAKAIKDADGKSIGGLVILVRSNAFFEKYVYPLQFGTRGYGFVEDSRGVTVAHPRDKSMILNETIVPAFVLEALQKKNGVVKYDWKGEDKIMAFATEPKTGWLICMSAYDSELAATATRQSYTLAGIGLLVAIVLAGVITLVNKRLILNPVLAIEQFTRAVAEQDYKAILSGDFKYEIGRLANNIRTMVAELKNRLGFSQGLLDGMTTSCIIADPGEKILFVNQSIINFVERTGKPKDFTGWTVSKFFYGEEGHSSITGQAIREKRAIQNVQLEIKTMKGAVAFTQVDAAPLYDLDGNLIAGFALFSDLTEIKRQQTAIQAQNSRIATAADEANAVSELTASASEELSAQIEQSRNGADLQHTRIQQMVVAIEEMNATVLEVARNASNAADNSEMSKTKAQAGADVVRRAVEAIGEVQRDSMGLKQNMSHLGDQIEGIGHIMNVISDIADQTNLLALNAAIEAARAGDAGRGFAVVADEVRKLAEKTMGATQEVGKSIHGIQQGARDAVARMDGAVASVERATTLAEQSGNSLSEIVELAGISSDQIRSIATASEEQSSASEEISRSVEDINTISTETAKAMKQSAQAVSELAEQTGALGRLIKALQTEDSGPKALH